MPGTPTSKLTENRPLSGQEIFTASIESIPDLIEGVARSAVTRQRPHLAEARWGRWGIGSRNALHERIRATKSVR